MKWSTSFFSLVTALPAVRGVVLGGPTPTTVFPDRALVGISPKPTVPPSIDELKKRQTSLEHETCGWIDGIYSFPVTCPGTRTCMLYTSGAGLAGCCDSTNTIDCGWASSCIDAAAYKTSGCGTNCLLNTLIRKCTDSALPYCVTWSYPSDGILDYGCATSSDSIVSTVLQRATDGFGATTSIILPTVAANPAITGSSSSSGSSSTSRKGKKIGIGLIIGIVVVALFVLFCIAVGILFILKKKKKQRQIAANTQAMAAVNATRPQSQYAPPPQQPYQYAAPPPPPQAPMPQQPNLFSPPVGPQSPLPPTGSYFPPGKHEEKPGVYASVHEYASPVSPPVSSPSTPAPVYAQPHGVPPPLPVVSPYQAHAGAHEVDAVSVPRAPGQGGNVHEIGSGK